MGPWYIRELTAITLDLCSVSSKIWLYIGRVKSIPWLLIPWFHAASSHDQQTLYRWVNAKKDVTSLLMHWSYIFLALNHRYFLRKVTMTCPMSKSWNGRKCKYTCIFPKNKDQHTRSQHVLLDLCFYIMVSTYFGLFLGYFESCIQQRKTTCILSIRISLACVRTWNITANLQYFW